jgi:polyphenol oxidase
MIQMQQVHGNNVVRVSKEDDGKTIPNCDALITNDPGVVLCVRVADCLPISVIDKKGRGVGLIHAGWRGLENGIITKTILEIENHWKVEIGKLKIAIGPHICAKHFEVKSDVLSKFSDYPEAISEKDGKIFLDLAKIAELQLIELGVKKENITIDPRCTFEDKSLYSFRRNKTPNRNLYFMHLLGVK